MSLAEELDLDQAILDLFGDICHDRLIEAGLDEDVFPTSLMLLTKIRECVDEIKFRDWVSRYILAMAPEEYPKGNVIGIVPNLEKENNDD